MAKKKRTTASSIVQYPNQSGSLFLRLPPEIRTLVYRAALVKHDGIDLWPNAPIADFADHPDLIDRVKHHDRSKLHFRHQRDLQYVRQNLAVSLLRTCHQIREEAYAVFWSENQFRFSSDCQWIGIRRFLLTIGPSARALLHTVEVAPPYSAFHPGDPTLDAAVFLRLPRWFMRHVFVKNHPKLHMAKLYAKSNQRCPQQTAANFAWVCNLLHQERALSAIKLVVPEQWRFVSHFFSDGFSDDLDKLRHLDLTLVIESGGFIFGAHDVATANSKGISVEIRQHANVSRQYPLTHDHPPVHEAEEILQDQFHSSSNAHETEWPGLHDVHRLFDEGFCDHAARTLAQERRAEKPVMRALKGFGGCRFVNRSERPDEYRIEVKKATRERRMRAAAAEAARASP